MEETTQTVEEPTEESVEAVQEPQAVQEAPTSVIDQLLALESAADSEAANYPDGPNCDAIKANLVAVQGAIAGLRYALDTNRRLTR